MLEKVANVDCAYNLTPEELNAKVAVSDALIVRSATKVGDFCSRHMAHSVAAACVWGGGQRARAIFGMAQRMCIMCIMWAWAKQVAHPPPPPPPPSPP